MNEHIAFTAIFGVFLVHSFFSVLFDNQENARYAPSAKPTLGPMDHLRDHPMAADHDSSHISNFEAVSSIKIQYCHSCGYKQAFDEISKLLAANFPEVKIIGEYHQPSWLRSQIVNLLFISKIALLAMIYMDINPFNYLQMETPRIWTQITQSKVPASLIILFMTNSIESNMMSTGAFEMYFNDMPIWSKISTGRMPSAPELLQIVGSHVKLGETSKLGQFRP